MRIKELIVWKNSKRLSAKSRQPLFSPMKKCIWQKVFEYQKNDDYFQSIALAFL